MYFSRCPGEDEQTAFRGLIKAWQTVGDYGAFGAVGMDRFHGLYFDKKTESAAFEADMGSADPVLARGCS